MWQVTFLYSPDARGYQGTIVGLTCLHNAKRSPARRRAATGSAGRCQPAPEADAGGRAQLCLLTALRHAVEGNLPPLCQLREKPL